MLQLVNQLGHRLPWQLQHALSALCSYSTEAAVITAPTVKQANPQDYGIVLKKEAELASQVTVPQTGEVGVCSGAPPTIYKRQARIYCPTKTACQSGQGKTNHNSYSAPAWKLVFDTVGKWENPLTGWTSTADPLENVGRASLFFYNKEQAIAFCQKHGWAFTVEEPNQRRPDRQKRFAGYGDNFSVKRKGLPDLSHLPSVRQEQGQAKAAAAPPKSAPAK